MTPRQTTRPAFVRLAQIWMAASCLAAPVALIAATPAAALSEIGREDLPPPQGTPGTPAVPMPGQVPSPDSDTTPDDTGSLRDDVARPGIDDDGPLPEIVYNLDRLPEPVRRMHRLLVEAAKSGDIEKLRPLLGTGSDAPQLSFGEFEGDPIEFLKAASGDPEGQEILAILEEVLAAGFVHLEAGTPNDIYVWPYFFGIPLDRLDAKQRVELFKIITAGDLEDMKQFGAYIFYRVGITPEGRWAFFVAGE
ncbi:hypothetical protein [Mesorhizobium marinum]|uniref:hypothetical protein n=1 Tax=Mesorhizobium marinum TaxID=3228790 RepID=UPI003466D308